MFPRISSDFSARLLGFTGYKGPYTSLNSLVSCLLNIIQVLIDFWNPHDFCWWNITSNKQRLRSAGNNDRRSKRFCSNAVLCVGFTWQIVKTHVIRLGGVEGWNVRDQIASCALHTFLVEVQTNAGYIHAMHA